MLKNAERHYKRLKYIYTDKYYSAGAHMTQEQERERTNNGRTGSQMPLTLCCRQVRHQQITVTFCIILFNQQDQ